MPRRFLNGIPRAWGCPQGKRHASQNVRRVCRLATLKRSWRARFPCPTPQPTDFVRTRPPADVAPNLLKTIANTTLRSRLIGAGLAQGVQSPKGPQKIASIVRLYPAFDAPTAPKTASGSKITGRSAGKAAQALPTVEEVEALLKRIRAIEGHVARELSMSIEADVAEAQRRVADAAGGDVDEAFRALGALLEKRKDARRHVRETAFTKIEADKEFPLRGYLRLLAREIGSGADEEAPPANPSP